MTILGGIPVAWLAVRPSVWSHCPETGCASRVLPQGKAHRLERAFIGIVLPTAISGVLASSPLFPPNKQVWAGRLALVPSDRAS